MPVNTAGTRHAVALHAASFGAGTALQTALAIGYAESGLKDNAQHKNSNGTTDYGFMQINSVHKDLFKNLNPSSMWANPITNAAMAYKVYSDAGRSFRPWSTFNSGAYRSHMAQAATDIKALQANGPDWERQVLKDLASGKGIDSSTGIGGVLGKSIGSGVGSAISGIGDVLGKSIGNAVSNVVLGAFALTFLVLGVVILLRSQIASKTPLGKAAKVAKALS